MSNQLAPAQPINASHPFNKNNADVILRSSDHVDFRVYSQILMAASPVFEDMFRVPQPPADEQHQKDGLPIVELSEDSAAIESVLRLSYPILKPVLRRSVLDVEKLERALRAAMKYEMELATSLLIRDLYSLASFSPLSAFGLACRLHLEDAARVAADHLRAQFGGEVDDAFLSSNQAEQSNVLRDVTAGQYFRLQQYLRGPLRIGFSLISPRPKADTDPHRTHTRRDPPTLNLEDIAPTDIVCVSSDGFEIQAHSIVLSATSPVLRTKISDVTSRSARLGPVPEGRLREDGLPFPVLQLDVSGWTLLFLLSRCYPSLQSGVPLPQDCDLRELLDLIVTAERLDIQGPLPELRQRWSTAASNDPLQAYFLAINAGDRACAKAAARSSLRIPIKGAYVLEMESSPALAYHRLLSYWATCGRIAASRLRELLASLTTTSCGSAATIGDGRTAFQDSEDGENGDHPSYSGKVRKKKERLPESSYPSWLQKHITELNMTFEGSPEPSRLHPGLAGELIENSISYEARHSWCSQCRPIAQDISQTSKQLQAVAEEIRRVEITV
ncbi:hypothetical protein BD414DRAFT_57707 [Trametes punicea]|nr:hypothetical protein BD414DRAFT_57707 [Trametes punicea]